jgi:hypothetical protein
MKCFKFFVLSIALLFSCESFAAGERGNTRSLEIRAGDNGEIVVGLSSGAGESASCCKGPGCEHCAISCKIVGLFARILNLDKDSFAFRVVVSMMPAILIPTLTAIIFSGYCPVGDPSWICNVFSFIHNLTPSKLDVVRSALISIFMVSFHKIAGKLCSFGRQHA